MDSTYNNRPLQMMDCLTLRLLDLQIVKKKKRLDDKYTQYFLVELLILYTVGAHVYIVMCSTYTLDNAFNGLTVRKRLKGALGSIE